MSGPYHPLVPSRDLRGSYAYPCDDLDNPNLDLRFIGAHQDDSPAPVPWYWTKPAVFAMAMIGIAILAILVSSVLLVSRDSRRVVDVETPMTTYSTPPSSPAPATNPPPNQSVLPSPSTTPQVPPPDSPPAEPPPPEPPPPPAATQPAPQTRSERPEIGVTRTPVTRTPISVAPRS